MSAIAAPLPFVNYARDTNEMTRRFFALCAAAPECQEHFDGDPWEVAVKLMHKLDAGHPI